MISAPATLPYLISAIYSWRVATDRRCGDWVFLAVLVAGAALVNLLILGRLGIDAREVGVLQAAGLQTVLYVCGRGNAVTHCVEIRANITVTGGLRQRVRSLLLVRIGRASPCHRSTTARTW